MTAKKRARRITKAEFDALQLRLAEQQKIKEMWCRKYLFACGDRTRAQEKAEMWETRFTQIVEAMETGRFSTPSSRKKTAAWYRKVLAIEKENG